MTILKVEINNILKDTHNSLAATLWWNVNKKELGGLTPCEAWDSGLYWEVYNLAKDRK